MLKKLKLKLRRTEAEIDRLKAAIDDEVPAALERISAHFGFETLEELLLAAERTLSARRRAGRSGRSLGGRPPIVAAKRGQVLKLARAGRTGRQIADAVGISLPSVQKIKKEAGLVKAKARRRVQGPSREIPPAGSVSD